MPLDTVWNITVQWYAGDAACKLLNFLKLFAMYSSSLVLVVISLDRQAAILHPFSFTSAGQRNRNMLAVAWAASAVLASPQLFLFHLQKASGLDFTQCVTMGSFQQHWQETLYNMFTFLTLYVMPLSAMVVCYSRILWEISRQMKEDRGLVRSNNDHFSKARMKTLRMTIVMVVSFIVCWTPYYLLGLWYWFRPEMLREIPEYVNHTLLLFGLLHTCSDPVVYGLYTPSFREDLYACWGRLGSGLTRHRLAHRPPSLSFLNVQDYGLTADLSVHGSVGSVTSNGTAVQTGF
ncbi:GNRR2 protein, partial [Amia calva]|nr:GNRR2 protein [Amia calva]